MSEQLQTKKLHGVKKRPKNITIAEIKSTTLKKSPVSKNKLFINIIPPKKILNEKIIGTPNIPASRRIAAHKSISPSNLTIIHFSLFWGLKLFQ